MKLIVILITLTLLLLGCSNPEEEARGLFNNAKILLSEEKLLEAKDHLTKITKEYSSTRTATEAIDELNVLNKKIISSYDKKAFIELKKLINLLDNCLGSINLTSLDKIPKAVGQCDLGNGSHFDEVPSGVNVIYRNMTNLPFGTYKAWAYADSGLGSKVYSYYADLINTPEIRTTGIEVVEIEKRLNEDAEIIENYKGVKSIQPKEGEKF